MKLKNNYWLRAVSFLLRLLRYAEQGIPFRILPGILPENKRSTCSSYPYKERVSSIPTLSLVPTKIILRF